MGSGKAYSQGQIEIAPKPFEKGATPRKILAMCPDQEFMRG